jgi:hypothetical protein
MLVMLWTGNGVFEHGDFEPFAQWRYRRLGVGCGHVGRIHAPSFERVRARQIDRNPHRDANRRTPHRDQCARTATTAAAAAARRYRHTDSPRTLTPGTATQFVLSNQQNNAPPPTPPSDDLANALYRRKRAA